MLIRDGDRVGRGRESEGSTARTDPQDQRPRRPWTAARTMEVLRRCPLAIAQQLVYYAVAVSTAVLGRVTRTMSVAQLEAKKVQISQPSPPSLLMISSGLTTGSSITSLLLVSSGPCNLRAQHHLPPLHISWTLCT